MANLSVRRCVAVILILGITLVSQSSTHVLTRQTEYDPMHPQLLFMASDGVSGGRPKRAMPPLRFVPPQIETHTEYWSNVAKSTLRTQLHKNRINKKRAKNIIMFLGDGMSLATLTATRIYMGGEEKQLSFERFPYTGLSKTYCANTQVADSACTATAYLCGLKANYGTIGVTAAVQLGDCLAENNTAHHVESIAALAQANGLSTGLVTTTQVTHASPAGVYAHTANRNWESNQALLNDGGDPETCTDIAQQLINGKVGSKLKVVFGGGRQEFLPKQMVDVDGKPGKRTDGNNLVRQWKHKHREEKAHYVETKEELMNLPKDAEYAFGLFHSGHMPFNLDADHRTKPSLSDMVEKAIDVLEQNANGYFLFVEGGRIDHGHHDAHALYAIDETLEFHKAIDLTKQRTNEDNTLIVVTSDHSHTMSISGYSSRGNDILGINDSQMGADDLPYTTINYANGPGHRFNLNSAGRKNLKQINVHDKAYAFPSAVPLESETHGGDDVGVFANGPWSHIFTGTLEQHYLPHAMAYAACLQRADFPTACSED